MVLSCHGRNRINKCRHNCNVKPVQIALPSLARKILYGYDYNMLTRNLPLTYRRRPFRPRPAGPFAPLRASPITTVVEHWRLVGTPEGPYVLDGFTGDRPVASVCIAIDHRGTIARLAEGWVVLGCRYDANAGLPDETEVIRRAAAWIGRGKTS